MQKIVVIPAEFEAWAAKTEVLYASTSVPAPAMGRGVNARLVFAAFIVGGYVVRCGNDEVYRGNDFAAAAKAFNDLV